MDTFFIQTILLYLYNKILQSFDGVGEWQNVTCQFS